MAKPSEKSIGLRPAGEKRRRSVLILSAALLILAFPPVYNNVPYKTPFVVAFLLPAVQNGLALYDFDGIRSSQAVVRRSFILEQIVFVLSIAMFVLTSIAEPSSEVWLLISCVYMIWGFLFELGLGLASKFMLPNFYALMSLNLALGTARADGTEMTPVFWATVLAPTLLAPVLTTVSWFYGEAMFVVDPSPEEAEIMRV